MLIYGKDALRSVKTLCYFYLVLVDNGFGFGVKVKTMNFTFINKEALMSQL